MDLRTATKPALNNGYTVKPAKSLVIANEPILKVAFVPN